MQLCTEYLHVLSMCTSGNNKKILWHSRHACRSANKLTPAYTCGYTATLIRKHESTLIQSPAETRARCTHFQAHNFPSFLPGSCLCYPLRHPLLASPSEATGCPHLGLEVFLKVRSVSPTPHSPTSVTRCSPIAPGISTTQLLQGLRLCLHKVGGIRAVQDEELRGPAPGHAQKPAWETEAQDTKKQMPGWAPFPFSSPCSLKQ